ncbi:MAG: (2Fe-2S)-binding protein [bacterium]|jgi:carbon-monoxide dehydrogenase small subunit|nr:(2Fe-2S)-binding protein [Betaproteobacteria bacterium]
MSRIELTLNGKAVSADVEDRTLLVNFLRDAQQLTGTHVGCDTTQCGACTVLVDGRALKSCTLLAVQVSGAKITTIEGMANGEVLHPVQQAFSECHGLQCGYCTPGMVMAVTDLLRRHPKPTDEQILHGLEGNICRCTGYINIVKSVKRASELMAAG